jgi:chemotaxis protein CheD
MVPEGNKMEIIKVRMADFKVSQENVILKTMGLGSCVGIALYDPTTKIGGLAHIMLPDSNRYHNSIEKTNLAKFADSSIEKMLEKMKELGANLSRILAKIAGGAHMLRNETTFFRIGDENVGAVRKKLKEKHIQIVSEDTGADYGRTVELDLNTGAYSIRTAGRDVKII